MYDSDVVHGHHAPKFITNLPTILAPIPNLSTLDLLLMKDILADRSATPPQVLLLVTHQVSPASTPRDTYRKTPPSAATRPDYLASHT